MDRLACVDVPAFPIQVLIHAHPEWRGQPVALVAADRPQAPVLAINELARRAGVVAGQRYAAALSLVPALRTGTVSAALIERHVHTLAARLRKFSPDVEPSVDVPGVFWINARGLQHLFASITTWARAIRADLEVAGFHAAVVAGFTRFGTYAVAKTCRDLRVFARPDEERTAARGIPLARVDIAPDIQDFLSTLGVRTVGEFLSLPPAATRARLGDAAYRLHRLASGDLWAPLQPSSAAPVFERQADFDAPVDDVERMVFLAKRLLDALLVELATHGLAVSALVCDVALDNRCRCEERVRPAAPTLDAVQLVNLLRVRLSSCRLTARVTGLRVRVDYEPASAVQLRLLATRAHRDLDAAAPAFARLRAALGDDAIVRARLREAHLPHARVTWEPVARLADRVPVPRLSAPRMLVRRIYDTPERLSSPPATRARDWLRGEIDDGRATRIDGPYIVSGGWWRGGVHREYYFLSAPQGGRRWVYYDRPQRAWFLEGRVE